MIKIAIAGKTGAGKSTLAKDLMPYFPGKAYIIGFADPIRAAMRHLGVDHDHPLYRRLAQTIGHDICRDYNDDFFVQLMENRTFYNVSYFAQPHDVVIIDDVRYQNELNWCAENDFTLVYKAVVTSQQVERGREEGDGDHPSENAIDPDDTRWNVCIPYYATREESVQAVLREVLKKQVVSSETGARV